MPSLDSRVNYAENLAQQHGWQQKDIKTDDFMLRAYVPTSLMESEILTVYIEGDGFAWVTSSIPSPNPTPGNPLALKLAVQDNSSSAYLARPCQFVEITQQQQCNRKFWTSHRFSFEVIHATNQAINQLKRQSNAKKLILVGYSGGGSVAALVAARRQDVMHLITIAGNLDIKTWVTKHHLSALSGSLNPADDWQQLQFIPQTHYVGGSDRVVGLSVASAYAEKFQINHKPNIVVVQDFDHHCCWESSWIALKKQAITQ